ncbi:hypothetical protein ACFOSC_29730 [Streptantibioticus rubrisoli]|uniref:Uncharacterized protein n=1 Tax=Streptantibioticus rubrisoli TaxID=1387313 RepID=A0ABT1PFY0_9ACTN|nr:hypothetical protein [Streptantibioticus rubrisoli]MCQ4044273.1 hypothetical protein [Streptantibioticus rubrisoli]
MTRPRFEDVPRHPRLSLIVTADRQASLDGTPVEVPDGTDPRVAVCKAAVARARELGRPVSAVLREADGQRWPMIITPEGGVFQGERPLRRRDASQAPSGLPQSPPAQEQPDTARPPAATSPAVSAEQAPRASEYLPAEPLAAPPPSGAQAPPEAAPPVVPPVRAPSEEHPAPQDVDPDSVPAWPLLTITLTAEGTALVNDVPVPQPPGVDPRAAAVAAAAGHIGQLGLARPVRANATDPDGTVWPLIIHPNGTATAAGPAIRPERGRRWLRRKG